MWMIGLPLVFAAMLLSVGLVEYVSQAKKPITKPRHQEVSTPTNANNSEPELPRSSGRAALGDRLAAAPGLDVEAQLTVLMLD